MGHTEFHIFSTYNFPPTYMYQLWVPGTNSGNIIMHNTRNTYIHELFHTHTKTIHKTLSAQQLEHYNHSVKRKSLFNKKVVHHHNLNTS